MSRTTAEDQLRFLVSCIRHSNNGKVDFQEVAVDCDIVSKGAAAKRFERLLKQYNLHESNNEAKPNVSAKKKSRADMEKAAEAKRRKIEGTTTKEEPTQDDDCDVKPTFLKHEPWERHLQQTVDNSGAMSPFMSHEATLAPALPLFPQPMSSSPSMNTAMTYLGVQQPQQQSPYTSAPMPSHFHSTQELSPNFMMSSQQPLLSTNRQPFILKQEELNTYQPPTSNNGLFAFPAGIAPYDNFAGFNGFVARQDHANETPRQYIQHSPAHSLPEQQNNMPPPPQEVAWNGDLGTNTKERAVETGTAPANSIVISD